MVASDVGVGLGILTALRSTAFRAARAECSIPSDLANRHSVTMDTLRSAARAGGGGWGASSNSSNDVDGDDEYRHHSGGKETAETRAASRSALRGAVVEMADLARFHLHRARDGQSDVPKEGRAALLPAVCGLHYLDALGGCDYDVLHPSLVGAGRRRRRRVDEDDDDDDDDDDASSGSGRRRRLGLMFSLGRTWLTGTF